MIGYTLTALISSLPSLVVVSSSNVSKCVAMISLSESRSLSGGRNCRSGSMAALSSSVNSSGPATGNRRYGRMFTPDSASSCGCACTSNAIFFSVDATPFRRMWLRCSVKTVSLVMGMTESYSCRVRK
ncbi:hypothetical protein ACKS0A_08439 [Histoplasma ohiense]